jgi:hypothetical protein
MNILAALAADPNVSAQFRSAIAPKQFKSTVGRCRTFLSEQDRYAYERGVSHWPEPLPESMALSAPMSVGWHDKEQLQELADEARADAAREEREE